MGGCGGVNKVQIPPLAQMSACSERMFTSVSHIVDENRNRLTADSTEKLLSVKKTLTLHFSEKRSVLTDGTNI